MIPRIKFDDGGGAASSRLLLQEAKKAERERTQIPHRGNISSSVTATGMTAFSLPNMHMYTLPSPSVLKVSVVELDWDRLASRSDKS